MRWKKLYDMANKHRSARSLSPLVEAGQVSSALLTEKGNVYVGVCIDTPCGLGMCAERNAASTMITHGEKKIRRLVAILPDGSVGSPCGACREFLMQLDEDNAELEVLLDLAKEETVTLKELLPDWWGQLRFKENKTL